MIPPEHATGGWYCDHCGAHVPAEVDRRTKQRVPSSWYWSDRQGVVYCSARCSLEAFEATAK